jgi:hypothetical protein
LIGCQGIKDRLAIQVKGKKTDWLIVVATIADIERLNRHGCRLSGAGGGQQQAESAQAQSGQNRAPGMGKPAS